MTESFSTARPRQDGNRSYVSRQQASQHTEGPLSLSRYPLPHRPHFLGCFSPLLLWGPGPQPVACRPEVKHVHGSAAVPRPQPPRRVRTEERQSHAPPALPSGFGAAAADQRCQPSATRRPAAPRARAAGGRAAPPERPPSWTGLQQRAAVRGGPDWPAGRAQGGAVQGRGLEGGAGLGGLQEQRTAHARHRTRSRGGIKSKKVRFRHETGAQDWRGFPHPNECKLFHRHYFKVSNILYMHIAISLCVYVFSDICKMKRMVIYRNIITH